MLRFLPRNQFQAIQKKPIEIVYPGDRIFREAGLLVCRPDELAGLYRVHEWFHAHPNRARLNDLAAIARACSPVQFVIVFQETDIEGMRFPEPVAFQWSMATPPYGRPDFVGPMVINWSDQPNLR